MTFFIDYGHIYVPNGMFWGSTSRPHIGDLVMSLFLLWGAPFMTGGGPKIVHYCTLSLSDLKIKNKYPMVNTKIN